MKRCFGFYLKCVVLFNVSARLSAEVGSALKSSRMCREKNFQKNSFFSCFVLELHSKATEFCELQNTMTKRIILFGGSFDPIHVGHIEVAASAIEKLGADGIIFIPAKRSPHKPDSPSVCAEDRLKMVSLAIEGYPLFSVSDCEITRAEPSYTLDTVKHFCDMFGCDTEVCFLLGADTIADLPKWHRIEELMCLCRFCTMYRGGMDLPDFDRLSGVFSDERIAQLQADIVETPLVDISSTEIRARSAVGESIDAMVGPEVADYIKQNGLYLPRI